MDKQSYLIYMGVDQWRLQMTAGSPQLTVYCYNLGPQSTPLGVLLAEAGLQDQTEINLVSAIAKASQFPYHGGLENAWSAEQISSSSRIVILMGNKIAELYLGRSITQADYHQSLSHTNKQIFITYSPQQLLQDKNRKVETWQILQMATRIMETHANS